MSCPSHCSFPPISHNLLPPFSPRWSSLLKIILLVIIATGINTISITTVLPVTIYALAFVWGNAKREKNVARRLQCRAEWSKIQSQVMEAAFEACWSSPSSTSCLVWILLLPWLKASAMLTLWWDLITLIEGYAGGYKSKFMFNRLQNQLF